MIPPSPINYNHSMRTRYKVESRVPTVLSEDRDKQFSPNWKEIPHEYRHEGNFLTRTRWFQRMVDRAFRICDANGDGTLDPAELYAGILLVHINVARYAGAAACNPPSRKVVQRLFDASDYDKDGSINRQEFNIIMGVLSAHFVTRILSYYAVVIFVVPTVALQLSSLLQIAEQSGSTGDYLFKRAINTVFFLFVIPVLWNKIDVKSEQSAAKRTQKRYHVATYDTTAFWANKSSATPVKKRA